MTNKLGLYIHVPFCAAKCAYCDFYSLPNRPDAWDAYTGRLCADLQKQAAECTDYTVDTIYFGGGTPSLLGGARLARMLETAMSSYPVAPDAEISIEANPDSVTEEFLTRTRAAGANRLSLGIQSADDSELRMLGRIHTFRQAQDAVTRARRAGFHNLSVDLMYALPHQTQETLAASVDALVALEPQHISCYGLTLEPHTPMGRQNPALPDEDAQADMYLSICKKLARAGYTHYEISNFARPGYASRHNSRYWAQSPYLGFGPGAHGDFRGKRYEIPRDLTAFLAGDAAPIPEDTEIDRAAEYIMLSLRTARGFDAAHYQQTFGENPDGILRALDRLPERYLRRTETGRALTDEGFLVSNAVILAALEGR